jgi:hypothetical protein
MCIRRGKHTLSYIQLNDWDSGVAVIVFSSFMLVCGAFSSREDTACLT